MRLNDLVDAVHERGHTHGDLLRLGELEGPPEGGRDDLVQAISDVLFLPEIFLEGTGRSEEHTSELQSRFDLVCRLLLEKKKKDITSLVAQFNKRTNTVTS